jgi:hypothetical protein
MLYKAFLDTWAPSEIFSSENLRFALKNYFCIAVAAIIGNLMCCNVFVEMSAVMPSTMSLLLSRGAGSAFNSNLQRLLGVILGKVLPLIVMSGVAAVGVSGFAVTAVHLLLFFCYMTLFSYMYYTSPEWSTVGCLIAGFGCYGLVGTRTDKLWSDASFAVLYQEIGQVTFAIFGQLLVDVVVCELSRAFPRDDFVLTLRTIGTGTCASKKTAATPGKLVAAFSAIFRQDYTTFKDKISEAKQLLAKQDILLGLCHPKGQILLGKRPLFDCGLNYRIMKQVKLILAEMDILVVIINSKDDPIFGNPFDFVQICEAQKTRNFISILTRVFAKVQLLSEQAHEDFIEVTDEMKASELQTGADYHKIVGELGSNVRRQAAQRALREALQHMLELEHVCISSGRFKSYGSGVFE